MGHLKKLFEETSFTSVTLLLVVACNLVIIITVVAEDEDKPNTSEKIGRSVTFVVDFLNLIYHNTNRKQHCD